MSQQAAKPAAERYEEGDPLHPDVVARRRRRAQRLAQAQGVPQLTPERIAELGTGGPWSSDEEFESWLAEIHSARSRDQA